MNYGAHDTHSMSLQNVLGRYSDFPMDKSEQMYGVADLTQGSKSLQSRETSSRTAQLSNLDLKKDKVKKPKLIGVGEKVNRSIPQSVEIRKASVQPFSSHSHMSSLLQKNADSANQPVAVSLSKPSLTSSSISTSAGHSVTQQISDTTLSSMTKGKKKVKRKRKLRSPLESEFDIQSESIESTKTQPEAPESVEFSKLRRPEVSELVEPSKPRPEALRIRVTPDNSGQNDVPDTGDVRHMLQELLYPPPVSLVTPIPTPNKVQPSFIFPTPVSCV